MKVKNDHRSKFSKFKQLERSLKKSEPSMLLKTTSSFVTHVWYSFMQKGVKG